MINSKLAANGAAYTVENADLTGDDTVALIDEAVDTYNNYKNSLVNIRDLVEDMIDDEEGRCVIENEALQARYRNTVARDNFEESLASFNARGIGKAYVITSTQVPQGLENEEAVADYVASLVTDDSLVYVSDIASLPILDDEGGTYTGNETFIRFVYIANGQAD